MAESLNFLNTVLGAFILGTFPVRPFLVLGYAALLGSIYWVYAQYGKNILQGKVLKYIRLTAVSTLVLLFAIAFCFQFSVFHTYGIPERGYSIFFTGEEITSTRLAHNHFGKVVIATALAPWLHDIVPVADSGAALVPYLPKVIVWLMLLLFSIAAFGALVLAPVVLKEVKGMRRRIAMSVLYGAVSFIALTKALDGGIVSDSAGIALGVYVGLLFFPKYFYKVLIWSTAAYAAVLLLLYTTGFYWTPEFFFECVIRNVLFVAFLFLLYYVAHIRITKRAVLFVSAGSLILFLALGLFVHRLGEVNDAYLTQTIQSGREWIAAYPWEAQPTLPRVGSVGRLTFYNADEFAGTPVSYALDSYHLPYWYMPISQFATTCLPAAIISGEYFSLLSSKQLVNTTFSDGIVKLTVVPTISPRSGWYAYQAQIVENGCAPRYMDVMREAIRAAGSDRAIAYNIVIFTAPASSLFGTSHGDKDRGYSVPVF